MQGFNCVKKSFIPHAQKLSEGGLAQPMEEQGIFCYQHNWAGFRSRRLPVDRFVCSG
jgi:hypothetical protein